jgi:hypothetical protein
MRDLRPENAPTIKQLGGSVVDLLRNVERSRPSWSAFNPSIGYQNKKGMAIAIRSSNFIINSAKSYQLLEGNSFKSQVWFSELDNNLKLRNLRKIDFDGLESEFPRGFEDPKLFWRDSSWNFTCVVTEGDHPGVARTAVAKLDSKAVKVIDFVQYPGPEPMRPEKNWMAPYQQNPHFDFVYGPNATIKNNRLTSYMTDKPELSMLRGSTNLHLLGNDTYLAVLHKKYSQVARGVSPATFGTVQTQDMHYFHYFAQYDYKGNIIGLSRPFQFYKSGVEFAAGLIMREKDFLISFGREDVSSHIAVLPVKTVLESLQPITY